MNTEEFERARPDTSEPLRPVRKQRMGVLRPQVEEAVAEAAVSKEAAAPVRKQRMGDPSPGTPPPAAETSTDHVRRKRMGDLDSMSAAKPEPATRQRIGASTPATRARMGAPTSAPEQPTPAAAPDSASEPEKQERLSPSRIKRVVTAVVGVVVVALLVVFFARWLRDLPAVQDFVATYPGHLELPESAPVGIPAWMGWQHFLNMFFIVLIVRTGLLIRTEKRPPGYWQAKKKSFFSPHNGEVKKVPLSQWLHQILDVLWIANGAAFIILLSVTGQWMKIVPTSMDIFPNMASTALQYASLQWPDENGWIHYNALQMVAYFLTVYVAAPLAVLSGLRMSTWWSSNAEKLNKVYPIEIARALHFPVMIYFVGFTIVHVFLVFFTGALRNLNHMYTSRDVADFWGLIIFLVSIAIITVGWFLIRPMFTTPIATRMGNVTKN